MCKRDSCFFLLLIVKRNLKIRLYYFIHLQTLQKFLHLKLQDLGEKLQGLLLRSWVNCCQELSAVAVAAPLALALKLGSSRLFQMTAVVVWYQSTISWALIWCSLAIRSSVGTSAAVATTGTVSSAMTNRKVRRQNTTENRLEMIRLTRDWNFYLLFKKSMKQNGLEVSDLKRKIKLQFNEIQQSGKPNNWSRNLKGEHVRWKNSGQKLSVGMIKIPIKLSLSFHKDQTGFDSSLLLPMQVLEGMVFPASAGTGDKFQHRPTSFAPPMRHPFPTEASKTSVWHRATRRNRQIRS